MTPQTDTGIGGQLVGVLLAAGGGSRMGGPKALRPAAGRPLVVRAATEMMRGGCDRLVVVVGAAGAEVTELLMAERDLIGTHPEVVTNPEWPTGMASSVRAGLLRARDLEASAVLLHLVDVPDAGADVVSRLRDHWDAADRGCGAWVAAYEGEPRNPVLLAGELIPDVVGSLHGDAGARRWLEAHPDHVTPVECADIGSGEDLDTPADLRDWQTRQDPRTALE